MVQLEVDKVEENNPIIIPDWNDKIGKHSNQKNPEKPTVYGRDYEGYIAMLFILRAVLKKFRFKVGVEIKQAHKFDDVVFLYEKQKKEYSKCMQIKHTTSKKKYINSMSLLSGEQSDFSIVKYFFSFKDLVKEDFFKEITQEDLIIYTNCSLDENSTIGENMIVSKVWQIFDTAKYHLKSKTLKDLLEPVRCNNDENIVHGDIFDVKTDESRHYRFNKTLINILKSKANEYNVTRLAQALKDWLMNNKTMDQVEYIINPYWKFLTEEVIDVNGKKFHDSFLNKQHKTKEAQFFYNKLIEEFERKNRQNSKKNVACKSVHLTIDYLNEKAKTIVSYPNWEFSNEEFDINNVIKMEEIEAFLKLFVFSVGQPNHEELKKIIKADLLQEQREMYGNDDFYTDDDINRYVDEIFHHFLNEVFKWKNEEGDRNKSNKNETYITHTNGKEFLENRWKEVKFGIQEPLKSFMGREDEMESLHRKICRGRTIKSQTNVVCGLPGMGKSELVRGYVQKYSRRYENKIFWIDGKSSDSIEDSFKKLAESLKIHTKTDDGKLKKIEMLVTEVYLQFRSKKCMIIFDDVLNEKMIVPFMPKQTFDGNLPFVLITSTNSNWGADRKTDLDVLTEKNAIKLIEKQASINAITESNNVERLVQILEYFPLAIQQVAAYIVKEFQKNSNFTIAQCIESFSENSETILEFQLPKSISNYEKTTFTNFKNIIDSICEYENIGDNALKVLGVMSFIDTNNIAMSWFTTHFSFDLNEIYQVLKEYSITRIESGDMSIHSLVQLVTRLILKQKGEEKPIIEVTFQLFCKIYPEGKTMTDLATKRILTPHLKMFISHIDDKRNSCTSERKTSYLEKLLWMHSDCFSVSKEPKKRKRILERLFRIKKSKYGKYDVETAKVLMGLGIVQSDLGNYSGAKTHFNKAKTIFLKAYGENHIETAELWMHMGTMESGLCNYDAAKSHFQRALAIFTENFGEDHQKTASALMGMALVESDFGNYVAAKTQFEKVLNVYLSIFEEDHVETAEVLLKLGNVELHLGNYAEAKSHYLKVLTIFTNNYGADHLETANVLIGLGTIESDLGNYSEAKAHFKKALVAYLNS
ncbi:uncharacterized protein LOC143917349 [Arctopsyche grandis]|uniref:uncharacterized protein LOC143917349 n=1 Tax=Arctopsyche grandis TaxID=121162 RepID=UPI00406D8B00